MNRRLPDFKWKECVYCGSSFRTRWGKSQTCSKICNRRKWECNNPEKVATQRKRSDEWKKKTGYRLSNETRRAWYHKNKNREGFLENINAKAVNRNRAVKSFLAEYKLNAGCSDCGFDVHHVALEFDHINGEKSFNVCDAKSIQHAKNEILKCEVVCSNCHRIRTYMRMYPCKDEVFKTKYEPVEE